MRIVCCITKATETHSEYIIVIALPLQNWLHERASVLRYTYIACLVYVPGLVVLIHGVDRSPYLMQLTASYRVSDEDALQAKIADMRTIERIMEPTDRVRKLALKTITNILRTHRIRHAQGWRLF